MSLSQKHFGKILVPWFNKSEWLAVYELIYDEDEKNWTRALDILRIWKQRTPHLSAGLEGTLIVLEVLALDTQSLSEFETGHVYSAAVIRFLNLCTAKEDKQGSFYKTAQEYELPQWLISLRHEISHGHKLPAISLLEIALQFCFDWLESSYWQFQMNEMEDLVVRDSNEIFSEDDLLNCAIYVSTHVSFRSTAVEPSPQITRTLKSKIKRLKKYTAKKWGEGVDVKDLAAAVIGEKLKSNPSYAGKYIVSFLVKHFYLLCFTPTEQEDGRLGIPENFIQAWKGLFQNLHQYKALPILVKELFEFMCNTKHEEEEQRQVASLWIAEIFRCYISLRNTKNNSNSLALTKPDYNIADILNKDGNFASMALERRPQYTTNFLKLALEHDGASKNFIEDSLKLMSAVLDVEQDSHKKPQQIFTLDDLDLPENIMDIEQNEEEQKPGWFLIKDASVFRATPLGILPHQARNRNPVLSF